MTNIIKLKFTFVLLWVFLVSAQNQAQNYIEVGAGITQNTMPIYSSWNYSWSSQIYNHNDLGVAKTITAIGLDCINGPKTVTNQKIYVKLTSSEVFSSANYEDPLNNEYTLVFDGNLTFQNGWNEIQLFEPINYDGVQNIIFHWENRWGTSYGPTFNSTPTIINNNKNCGSDVSFPGAGSSGYLNPYPSSLTNVRFYFQSSGPATPINPLPADNSTRVSVDTDLSWEMGVNTISYDIYLGTNPQELDLIGADIQAVEGINSFLLNGFLADSTMHYWKVVAKNEILQESSPVWKFRTEVVIDEFPYSQSFEDSTVFNTWPVESAWITIPEFSWYEMDVNANSGLLCAKSFFLNNNLEAILQSPKIFLPSNSQISFSWANMDASRVAGYDTTYFEVSTNGGQNWEIIDYLSPMSPTGYIERTHNLSNFAGNNFYFRFRYRTTNNSNSHSVYLDDIVIEEGSVGLNEIDENFTFSVYPNPGDGCFNVNLPENINNNGVLILFDLTGKKLFETQICQNRFYADFSVLTAGIYILKAIVDNNQFNQKLIIN